MITGAFALAGPAGAESITGSGTDASGDAPSAALDITALDASYDAESGAVEMTVKLAAPPPPGGDGFLGAVLGPPAGSPTALGCGEPFLMIGAFTDPTSTERR